MGNEDGRGPEAQQVGRPQPHWREMLSKFPAIRQVFHALCAMEEDEDAAELLDFAVRQEWMAGLARRAAGVARLDRTMPCEPETDDLMTTLWELYAASRVRDALLLPHQPAPAGDSVRELDEALHREAPRCRPVPVGQITEFFAAIGCARSPRPPSTRSCTRSSPARPPQNPMLPSRSPARRGPP